MIATSEPRSIEQTPWVSLAEAMRLTGRTSDQIKNLAASRMIATDAPGPGCRLRYRRSDLVQLGAIALAS